MFDLREYIPGDDIRSIHWKLSSKLGKPVIREFSRPNNYRTMILCDLSLSLGGREVSPRTISSTIAISGAISFDMSRNGMGHSLCVLGKNIAEVAEINSAGDATRLRNAVMNITLEKGEFNTAAAFAAMPQALGVSRLIYVAKEFDSEALLLLAAHTDITVVTSNESESAVYADERSGSLEIISLDSRDLYDALHTVYI